MKKVLSAVLVAALLVPSVSYAREWHEHGGDAGAAIVAGLLGGLAAGVILDRVLLPPSPAPVYSPPPFLSPDPYDSGYSDGYSRGVERGRYERYEQGRRQGYENGYEDARAGRAY